MEEEAPINYRTAGTKALNRGKIVTSHNDNKGKIAAPSVPSIPSKLETVLYQGDRENKAFGSQALRFQEAHPDLTAAGGPASYSLPSALNNYLNAPSWGKRGTGGFASVSKRFVPKGLNFGPGPGAYVVSGSLIQHQSLGSDAPSANFCQHDSKNPLKKKYAVPGPGNYNIRRDKLSGKDENKYNVGTSNFTSGSKRMFGKKMSTLGPGPGQYKITPDPVMPTEVPSRIFSAPTEKKLVSKCVEVVNPPLLEHADKAEEFVKTARGQTRGDIPGPGAYTLKSSFVDKKPNGGKKSAQVVVERSEAAVAQFEKAQKIRNEQRRKAPGPGQYDPKVHMTSARNITCFRSTSIRNKEDSKKAPGPAYYKVERKKAKNFHLNLKGSWV